jgi:hypothetical protein
VAAAKWRAEYAAPAAERTWARAVFLVALGRVGPHVLRDLRDRVLPVYEEAGRQIETRLANREAWEADERRYRQIHGLDVELCRSVEELFSWGAVAHSGLGGDVVWRPDLIEPGKALRAWAERWHLDAEWIHDAALKQLSFWGDNPRFAYPTGQSGTGEECDMLCWMAFPATAWFMPVNEDQRAFVFRNGGWEPTGQTRKEAREAITAEFARELENHLDAIEARAAEAGFGKITEHPSMRKHMEWLALYQVDEEMNFSRIGRLVYVAPRSVRDAILAAAALVELEPRKPKVGAPRGTRPT